MHISFRTYAVDVSSAHRSNLAWAYACADHVDGALLRKLWNAVVDQGDVFLLAQYSVFDEVPVTFHPISKGHDLLRNLDTDETLRVLRWFSAGYFNAVKREDGTLQLNDLRFGTFSGRATSPDDYIFRFKLTDLGPGKDYGFERAQGGPPDNTAEDMMRALWQRAQGLREVTP